MCFYIDGRRHVVIYINKSGTVFCPLDYSGFSPTGCSPQLPISSNLFSQVPSSSNSPCTSHVNLQALSLSSSLLLESQLSIVADETELLVSDHPRADLLDQTKDPPRPASCFLQWPRRCFWNAYRVQPSHEPTSVCPCWEKSRCIVRIQSWGGFLFQDTVNITIGLLKYQIYVSVTETKR